MPVSSLPLFHFFFLPFLQSQQMVEVRPYKWDTASLDCGHSRHKQKISSKCLQRRQQCIQDSFFFWAINMTSLENSAKQLCQGICHSLQVFQKAELYSLLLALILPIFACVSAELVDANYSENCAYGKTNYQLHYFRACSGSVIRSYHKLHQWISWCIKLLQWISWC